MFPRQTALGRLIGTTIVLVLAAAAALASPAPGAPLTRPRLVVKGYSDGVPFNQPRGVAFDPSDGAIYVANTGGHRIEVFSKTGRPLAQFVHRVAGPDGRRFDGSPSALAFDGSGRLLVVDPATQYVDVLDHRARTVARLGVTEGHPSAVAVAKDGTIFVAASGDASRIHRFRPDYTPDGSWGQDGSAPGTLTSIAAISVVDDTTLAVVCARTDLVVQLFTRDGRYLRGFGTHDGGDGNFSLPSGMVTTPDGRLWVLDDVRQMLQVFDGRGEFLDKQTGSGSAFGNFVHPSSLAFDGRGLMAVADRETGRVRVFAVMPAVEDGKQSQ